MVYLVGAGPGDPGLITMRGLDLLRRADVILHDRHVDRGLLSQMPDGAEVIDVGKMSGTQHTPQHDINNTLVARARRGLTVVRLKGGDPFVFGRGFEELTACREAGVDCVVIPGVSSALAVPAAVGIPITCRERVRSVAIIIGRVSGDAGPPPLDYEALAKIDTLIVLMGLATLADVTRALIEGGRDANTPAASIERGTMPDQRVVRGTLGTLAHAVGEAALRSPVVTVIGDVAASAEVAEVATCWAPSEDALSDSPGERSATPPPLAGQRVMLTRPRSRSRALRRALARCGVTVIECPMIEIRFPAGAPEADRAVRQLECYPWVVFTSVNAVEGLWRRVRACGRDARAFASSRLAAVGPATAKALEHRGLAADLVPEEHHAEALAAALGGRVGGRVEGSVLFPCGDRASRTIEDRLSSTAIGVERVVVYETIQVAPQDDRLEEASRDVAIVVFHSPSAVRRFVRLGGSTLPAAVCIGRTTAQAARGCGFTRVETAERATVSSTVAAAARAVHCYHGF